ncbi:hypothetical protein KEH51_25170 [[Brevibacterium] frigoritolerans]|uniref:Uncharacterized protein n=1 Tax=Peribacillus frigoritolerans TaxID=450367 RepID=A0A941JBR6_9BACI|nr:hypothetical protein [Peribacillus frigoritolerans]
MVDNNRGFKGKSEILIRDSTFAVHVQVDITYIGKEKNRHDANSSKGIK